MTDVFHRRRVLARLEPPAGTAGQVAGERMLQGRVVPIVALGAAAPLWTVVGPGAALLAGLLALIGPRLHAGWRRAGDERRAATELAGALEALARSLRTGASLTTALGEAGASARGPVGDELAAVSGRVGAGESLSQAMAWWGATTSIGGAAMAAAALGLGSEAGGAQARAVDAVASTLRQRLAAADQVRALASQARASAAVIGLAPLAFGLLAAATDDHTARFLLRSVPGCIVLVAGLGLDLAGALWMHRITGSVRP